MRPELVLEELEELEVLEVPKRLLGLLCSPMLPSPELPNELNREDEDEPNPDIPPIRNGLDMFAAQ